MKRNLMPSSKPPLPAATPKAPRGTRAAMTLIEIVAGLVILGTILASLAIARGRFARQWADADRRLAAARSLDALIAQWMDASPPQVPLNRQGTLGDNTKLIWRTRVLRDPSAARLGAAVVRVEVFQRGMEERSLS